MVAIGSMAGECGQELLGGLVLAFARSQRRWLPWALPPDGGLRPGNQTGEP
jgi:hypothetical protein